MGFRTVQPIDMKKALEAVRWVHEKDPAKRLELFEQYRAEALAAYTKLRESHEQAKQVAGIKITTEPTQPITFDSSHYIEACANVEVLKSELAEIHERLEECKDLVEHSHPSMPSEITEWAQLKGELAAEVDLLERQTIPSKEEELAAAKSQRNQLKLAEASEWITTLIGQYDQESQKVAQLLVEACRKRWQVWRMLDPIQQYVTANNVLGEIEQMGPACSAPSDTNKLYAGIIEAFWRNPSKNALAVVEQTIIDRTGITLEESNDNLH